MRKKEYHGLSHTQTYNVWVSMIQRCHNPNDPRFKDYGGRGISVCKRWRNSFSKFNQDMGPRPKGNTLDRKNNEENYKPSNCQWSTPKQQSRNTRRNRRYTVKNITGCMVELCEHFNLPRVTITYRIRRGWSVEKAFNTPIGKYQSGLSSLAKEQRKNSNT